MKDCPFCGSRLRLWVDRFVLGRRVNCTGCGASGPWRTDDDQAIAAWNEIAAFPYLRAALRKIVEGNWSDCDEGMEYEIAHEVLEDLGEEV